MLDEVRPYVADIKLGDSFDADAKLKDILSNTKIFGVNLYEAGLAELTRIPGSFAFCSITLRILLP